MAERWKLIPGHNNYAVSSHGNVVRATRGKGTRAGKPRKISRLPNGYCYVDLYEDGVRSRLYVHQAVLLAFKGAPPTKKHQAAHWDGMRSHNRLGNLRWATGKQNVADTRRHGRTPLGSRHKNSKLTERQVIRMRKLRADGALLDDLAARFKVNSTNVDFICRRVTWRHI